MYKLADLTLHFVYKNSLRDMYEKMQYIFVWYVFSCHHESSRNFSKKIVPLGDARFVSAAAGARIHESRVVRD